MKAIAYSLAAICLVTVSALGQQPATEKSNPLVDGKLMFVGKMPENLDSWIVVGLRSWGKYKPTRDPEGVGLEMRAYQPTRKVEYEMRQGIPQPKRTGKRDRDKQLMFTIVVTDWVTGKPVWEADILDRKQKNGRRENSTGSHSEIYARGLSSQVLAEEILRALRAYVAKLSEAGTAAGPAPQS